MIFGFAEDYRKIIVNVKHELILTRSRSDYNAVIQKSTQADTVNYENFKIQLTRVEWLMFYVMLSDKRKIQLFKVVLYLKIFKISNFFLLNILIICYFEPKKVVKIKNLIDFT